MLPLLGTIAGNQRLSFVQDLGYQTVGMVIVLGALFFLYLLLTLTGHLFRQAEAKAEAAAQAAQQAASAAAPAPSPAGSEESLPAEVRAAIFAAVYDTMGENARILDIQALRPEQAAWSMEGRRQIFLSHRVR